MKHLSFLLLCVLWSPPGSQSADHPPTKNEERRTRNAAPPHILILFVDDLGWNDLSLRNPVFETPNIDQLAADSLSFERASIASPTCSPSRGTLYTGKHPARLKLVRHIPSGPAFNFNDEGVPSDEFNLWPTDPAQFPCPNWLPLGHTTYAEALKERGYTTLFVGKWHLGHELYHPIHQGFDRQIGASNFGHPGSYYPPYFKVGDTFKDEKERYLTDKLTDEVVAYIDSYDKSKPFLINLAYYNVHAPPVGRKDLVEHFQAKGLEDKQLQYAAQVGAVDESVGRIREALDKNDLAEDTLILFLGDQGSLYSNAPLRGSKRESTLSEGGARVPFLLHWPGVTKPGDRNMTPIQSTDIFPTLVEIAGGDPADHEDLDGLSLLPLIKDGKPLDRDTLYGYRAYEDQYISVLTGGFKFVGYRSGKTELFDVENDIGEENNLAEAQPERVADFIKKLVTWEKEMGVAQYSGFNP